MKISVIIPVYNCEKYLSDCINSVLNQTYQKFEIILVNDGSKDKSGDICDEYARKDSRIRVIHQENHGVSHARNTGLRLAEGDAISFIDGDDTLEPDMYELLVNAMIEYHADVSLCGFKRVETDSIKAIYGTESILVQNTTEAVETLLKGDTFNGALWNKLIDKNLIKTIEFNESLKINEDVLFCFQMFMKAKRAVFLDYLKYNYYVRDNVSACFITADDKKMKDGLFVSEYIYNRLKGTSLACYASERYIRTLSSYFRSNKEKRSEISKQIWQVYKKSGAVSKNMSITAKLIHYAPFLYNLIYGIYDKIRKPNWEV